MTPPLIVGLTGGIASGKSTVGRMLAERGCEVVDADELVAALYAPGGEGTRAIAAIAGEEALDADGGVDHAALASRFFADTALRREIEAAVHPLVRKAFERIVAASEAEIVVLEATLLVEAGYDEVLDSIVTVEADEELRLRRAVARGLSEEQARARLEAQGDGKVRRAGADHRIDNDSTLDDLEAAVDALLLEWRELLPPTPMGDPSQG